MKSAYMWAVLLATTPAMSRDLLILGQDYPPFNWSEGGKVVGGMVEVVNKACERLKHTCKFELVPLARAVKMLEMGTAHGVMSLIPNAERAEYADFSPTLVVSTLGYFGIKGQLRKPVSLQDMQGWTVGAVRASSSLRVALENQKQVKDMTVVEEVNNEALVMKLQHAVYGDKGVILGGDSVLQYKARQAKAEIELVMEVAPQGFTTAFSKKSVDAKTFNDFVKTFTDMKKSGEMKAILTKYSLKTD